MNSNLVWQEENNHTGPWIIQFDFAKPIEPHDQT